MRSCRSAQRKYNRLVHNNQASEKKKKAVMKPLSHLQLFPEAGVAIQQLALLSAGTLSDATAEDAAAAAATAGLAGAGPCAGGREDLVVVVTAAAAAGGSLGGALEL